MIRTAVADDADDADSAAEAIVNCCQLRRRNRTAPIAMLRCGYVIQSLMPLAAVFVIGVPTYAAGMMTEDASSRYHRPLNPLALSLTEHSERLGLSSPHWSARSDLVD